MVKKEQIRPSYVGLCLHAITCVVHFTLCTLLTGLVIILAASRWRVRPQRLEGEEDDMTRMMEEDGEDRTGGRTQQAAQDPDYIGRRERRILSEGKRQE